MKRPAKGDALLKVTLRDLLGVPVWEVFDLYSGASCSDRDLSHALHRVADTILAARAIRSKKTETVPARNLRIPMALRSK